MLLCMAPLHSPTISLHIDPVKGQNWWSTNQSLLLDLTHHHQIGSQDSRPIFWRSIIGLVCLWFIDLEGRADWTNSVSGGTMELSMVLNSCLRILSLRADDHEAAHEPKQSPLTWQSFSEGKPTSNCVCKPSSYGFHAAVTWMLHLELQLTILFLWFSWLKKQTSPSQFPRKKCVIFIFFYFVQPALKNTNILSFSFTKIEN